MNKFDKVLNCCGPNPTEKDFVVDIKQIRRCMSSNQTEKRTYIKRSVGKNPILNLSHKYANQIHEKSPVPCDNPRSRQKNQSLKDVWTPQKFNRQIFTYKQNLISTSNCASNAQSLFKFSDFNSQQTSSKESQQIFSSQMQVVPNVPRLFQNRRFIKDKQYDSKKTANQTLAKKMPQITFNRGVQKNLQFKFPEDLLGFRKDSNQRTQVQNLAASNMGQNKIMGQTRLNSGSLNQRNRPLINISYNCWQALTVQTKQSKQMSDDRVFQDEQDDSIWMKLQKENSILQSQLNNLKAEQDYLREQKELNVQGYQKELELLHQKQKELKINLAERQHQINQIKSQIQSRINRITHRSGQL